MLHLKLKAFVKLFHTKFSQKQIQTGTRKPSEQTFRAASKNLNQVPDASTPRAEGAYCVLRQSTKRSAHVKARDNDR